MKLLSGGQSGVDRAVLDVALARGIAYSGWCPKGGWAEDFPEPPGVLANYPQLAETPLADPAQRTEWNVRDADAYLIVVDVVGGLEVSHGTALARDQAARVRRCAAERAARLVLEIKSRSRARNFALLDQPQRLASHRVASKQESGSASWPASRMSIAILSSTHGPTGSLRPPDMDSNQGNADLDQRFRSSNHIRPPCRAYRPRCERRAHQPCLGLGSDRRLSTGARAIIQRSQRAFGHGALDAALDRLMMQPECPADRKKRGVFPIGQQYPRPLHPARRFSARLRYRSQLRRISFSKRQLNRPPPRCHDFSSRSLVGTRDICGNPKTKMNPPL